MNYNSIAFLFCIFLTLCINSEQSDHQKFTVVSTSKPPLSTNTEDGRIVFDEQAETRKSLYETNRRLEKFELTMIHMQNTLEKLLKLHGVKPEEDFTAVVDLTKLSKIDKILDEKLRPCDNISTHIDNKLDEIKQSIVNEIVNKQKEQVQSSVTNLEQLKEDIVKSVSSQLNETRRLIDAFDKKLDSANNHLTSVVQQMNDLGKTIDDQKKATTTVKPVVEKIAQNCKEVFAQGNVQSRSYIIKPSSASSPLKVLCDMDTRGGGWTYFMRRFDGSQSFYLNWTDYRDGFGSLDGEFWLGLQHLYELTGSTPSELLFVFTDWEGKTVYSHFIQFSVGNEGENYIIKTIQGYSGDGGQSFMHHLNRKFSTLDRHDAHGNCVKTYHGPWWYGNGCFHVKLTGRYQRGKIQSYADGIHSSEFHGYRYSLKEAKMLVR